MFVPSLRAEAIKVRRLWLGVTAIAAGVAYSLLASLSLRSALEHAARERNMERPWQSGPIGDAFVSAILAFPLLVIFTTAMLFFIEHRTDMWKQLRVTPVRLGTVLIAKFVVVQLLAAAAVLAAVATALIVFATLPAEARLMFGVDDAGVRAALLIFAAKLFVSLIPLAVIQFALSAKFPNILHPVGIGFALTIASLLLSGPKTAPFLPYAYPGQVVMATFAVPVPMQMTDTSFRPPANALPRAVVVVDEAHGNRHGLGTFEQPGTLRWMEAAGAAVEGSYAAVTPRRLAEAKLFVVAGATRAFAPSEIAALKQWVSGGGSLLILTDHPPFDEPVRPLAAAFGATISTATIPRRAVTRFAPHEIASGVKGVVTYGGQTVSRAAGGAVFDQLLAFEFGRGRVVVSGETALFTAQRRETAIGVSAASTDNLRLVVNALRWLLRVERSLLTSSP